MDFAVDLIMTGIVFRLCNVRYGGVDLLPDLFGMSFVLIALLILRKREYEFRSAFLPWIFAFLLSAWSLYNFMPSEPSVPFGVLYVGAEGLLLLAECRMYKKLFCGFEHFYDETNRGGNGAVWLYAASKLCGIGLNLAMWLASATENAGLTLTYYGWVVVHMVIATWLMYRFYLLKPKFRPHGR